MKKLQYISPTIGADPEFFITSKEGKIIESSKVIPKGGLSLDSSTSKCTRDGVQAELNPRPKSCRQGAATTYMNMFKSLATNLNTKKVNMCSDSMIHLSQEELDELSKESRVFGCEPSRNYYTGKKSVISANPSVYGYRSAGGHIHLGYNNYDNLHACMKKEYKLIIKILDLVLGNTCVMIDRDENQVERRTVYGRAGEYRLPSHGIEYRTLSNFWLRSYQLMSMVYGFARLGLCIAYSIYDDERKPSVKKSCFREILDVSDEKNIEKAINNNDFDLAKENWNKIKDILVSMTPDNYFGSFPICKKYLHEFEHFIDKGLDYWFKDDILTHWTQNLKTIYGAGWERFLKIVVADDIKHNGYIEWSINSTGFRIDILPKPKVEKEI